MLGLLFISFFFFLSFLILSSGTFEEMSTGDIIALMPLCIGAVFIWGGYQILFELKGGILYLRKFGFQDSCKVLTYAITNAIGKRWRVVTLDDSNISSVGVSMWGRLSWNVGSILLILLLVTFISNNYDWFTGEKIDAALQSVLGDIWKNWEEGGLLLAFFGAIGRLIMSFFAVIVTGIFLGVITLIIFIFTGAMGTLSFFFVGNQISVLRAEFSRKISIIDGTKIESKTKRVFRRARRVLAPRLIVARVGNEIWREVVIRLGNNFSLVIIDVSQSSEHLLWEIRTFKERKNWLLIGLKSKLERLNDTPHEDLSPHERELKELIDGEEVLAYDDPRFLSAMIVFSNALKAKLD